MAIDYLAVIEQQSAAFAAAARSTPLDARVPTCPDWDLADLVRHLGRIQRWVAGGVRDRSQSRFARPDVPDEDLLGWFEGGTALLVAALGQADAGEVVWNFAAGAGPVSWWCRRQAHEVAMHRWDAQATAGPDPEPVDSELAADGIDEFLHVVVASRPTITSGSLHLHRTDGDGEWMVRFGPDGAAISREHGKGDTAVRGPAPALLLWLSNRGPADVLEVFGDADLVARWSEQVRF